MKIMYDGTEFHGWQYQPNGITVQETVEKTLSELLDENISVTGCSRTDAGVHAIEYYFNFHSDTKIPVSKLDLAFNNHLKTRNISVLKAYDVSSDFDSRFSSTGKEYIYKIFNFKNPNPFLSRYSWFFPYKLNIKSMNEAAQKFIGTYDFSAFMASGGSQKTTVRTIKECSVMNSSEWNSEIILKVKADAFLYNMVRIITGTLIDVGTGKIDKDEIISIIESKERKNAGMTAPPQGLHLKKVYYPDNIF